VLPTPRPDGVSVTAGQWIRALRPLSVRIRTVAGSGRPDVLVRGATPRRSAAGPA
jgi:hypothetical protein